MDVVSGFMLISQSHYSPAFELALHFLADHERAVAQRGVEEITGSELAVVEQAAEDFDTIAGEFCLDLTKRSRTWTRP